MALITISRFAKKHKVTRQAVQYRIDNKMLKTIKKYGIVFINDKQTFKPFRKND